MIELRKSSADNGMDVYLMLQTIPKEENGLNNSANGLTFEESNPSQKRRVFLSGINFPKPAV